MSTVVPPVDTLAELAGLPTPSWAVEPVAPWAFDTDGTASRGLASPETTVPGAPTTIGGVRAVRSEFVVQVAGYDELDLAGGPTARSEVVVSLRERPLAGCYGVDEALTPDGARALARALLAAADQADGTAS